MKPILVQFPRNPNAGEVLQQVRDEYGETLQDVVVLFTTQGGGAKAVSTMNGTAEMLFFMEQTKLAMLQLNTHGKVGA